MTEMNFEEYCEKLNDLAKQMQAGKETVSEEEAARAMDYAKNLSIYNAGDVLLFCTAINLMNTYVKQHGCRSFGYGFKGYVPRLIEQIQSNPIEGVRTSTRKDEHGTLTLVDINGIQFSFHCVKGAKRWIGGKPIPFDGVRKQKCASTLFKMAEANRSIRGNGKKDPAIA